MRLKFWIPLLVIFLIGGFLRFNNIATNPPGLYIDETSIGLNAYNILTTGKDQYGISYPLAFKSFGDYKMPGYIYATVASMKIFGKNEFAIRFPSASAGTLTILVVALLLRELLLFHKKTSKYADELGLLAGGILAILPWHLLISRGGFEVTLGMFLYCLGLLLFIFFLKTNKLRYILLTTLMFLFAMYTYHSYRVIVPITVITGIFVLLRYKKKRKNLIIPLIIFFILSLPLFLFTLTGYGSARFSQTSAFVENPVKNYMKDPADAVIYARNYFSYFSLTYLFRYGDQINRHQVNDFGLLYIWQLPFIFLGIYFLTKTKNKLLKFLIFFLLLIGPIPAALARPSPHSLRFLLGTIVFTLLTALGIYYIFMQKKPWVKFVFLATIFVAIIEFTYYMHYYYVHYPKEAIIDWGGGCKQVAEKILMEKNNFSEIVIDNHLGCIPEYFSFYIPQIPIRYINPTGEIIKNNNGKTLYVRPFYGPTNSSQAFYKVILPNSNHDTFAIFWKI